MNGAEALMRTLVEAGTTVCFMNPGTSEMHFVAALDRVPEMRGVLTLFEGVATGAADGYGRMTGHPAVALLHLGPGLANGLANLHNARRAGTPLVTVVGEHATFHQPFDAPLQSDIAGLAGPVSGWVRTVAGVADVGADTAAAVAAALAGRVATLIVPADLSWSEGAAVAPPPAPPGLSIVDADRVAAAAKALRSSAAGLLVGGAALREPGLLAAARVARATGARLLCETFPARLERGAGLPAVDRVAYLPEMAAGQLAGLETLVLAGARPPVTFFGYPDTPSQPLPDGCEVVPFAAPGDDVVGALAALASEVGGGDVDRAPAARPEAPSGKLDAGTFAAAVAATLPDGAIVVDEANTSGLALPAATAGAPRHDLLTLTGGSIGQGPPVAVGAAVAAPDRPVLNLQADGSAMYTLQAWWTQAREGLDVTTVLLNNRSYAILHYELSRVGAAAGGGAQARARSMLDLTDPVPDHVALARGMGVPAERVQTADELVRLLRRAYAEPGPHLIEAVL